MYTPHPATAAKLREALAVMWTHASQVDMGDWCSTDRPADLLEPSCGTVGCLAGFVLALDTRGRDLDWGFWAAACHILGLVIGEGRVLFFPDHWPPPFRRALSHETPGTLAYVEVIARRVEHFLATGE